MTNDERLAKIREFVNLQAEDWALWALPIERKQTAQEAYLQRALRKLYLIIESDNIELIDQIMDVYKKLIEPQKD